jgi:hypothetical protein
VHGPCAVDKRTEENCSTLRLGMTPKQRRDRSCISLPLQEGCTVNQHKCRHVVVPEGAPTEFGIGQRVPPIADEDKGVVIHPSIMQHLPLASASCQGPDQAVRARAAISESFDARSAIACCHPRESVAFAGMTTEQRE